jgi:metal-responsive CopG/Arc/MetJ family transcriptional regulator
MSAQLTVRLPDDLKAALDAAARRTQRNSSQLVRLALESYLGTGPTRGQRPAERVRNLIGSLESGVPDLADRHREYVLESLTRGS